MLDVGWPPVWRLLLLVSCSLAVSPPVGTPTHPQECKIFSAGNSTNNCPAGASALTQEECQDADAEFTGVEFGWASVIASDTDPKGCFRFGQNFYFNTHATGAELEDRSPFCKLCLPDAGAGSQAYVCAASARLIPGQLNAAEFRCADGGCLPVAAYCDGTFDCRDGSDETGCGAMSTLAHDTISEVDSAGAADGGSTGSPKFDCHASGSTEWSAEKKSWCCKSLHVGCASEQKKDASFDCDAQKTTWETSWSMPKRKWCCDHKRIGCKWYDCSDGPPKDWTSSKKVFCCRHHKETCPVDIDEDEDADGGSNQISATTEHPPDEPFDCRAGVLTWKDSWTDAKQRWCCERHHLGCRKAPGGHAGIAAAVYNCTEDADVGSWDERKRDWCCHHEARACPLAHYLLARSGQGSCPSGYQSILDHSMCKAAASALGGEECTDEHAVNADTRDFACTVTSAHGCVHFDDRHLHSSHASFRFVCVQALGTVASAGSTQTLTRHSVPTTQSAVLSTSSMVRARTTSRAVVLPKPVRIASTTPTITTTTVPHATNSTTVADTTIASTTTNSTTTIASTATSTATTITTTIAATTATTATKTGTTTSEMLILSTIVSSSTATVTQIVTTTTSSDEPATQSLGSYGPTLAGQLPEVLDAPLQCSVGFTGETGSLEDRCLAGNRFNDGFEYIFNSGRHTNHSACGNDECWCCRRRIAPALWHANLECSVGFAKDTGSLKNRCEAGNGRDGFQYVYNEDRGTAASCGECFCCRRPLAPLEQVHEFPIYMPGLMTNFEERCQYGNKIDDGFDYLFNHHRSKKEAVCGENAHYWCCKRRTAEALQVWQVQIPVKVWNKMSTETDVKQVGEKHVGEMVRGRLVDRTWVALYREPGFVLAVDRDNDTELLKKVHPSPTTPTEVPSETVTRVNMVTTTPAMQALTSSATTTTQTTATTNTATTRTDAHWIIVRAVTDTGNASSTALNATATTSTATRLNETDEEATNSTTTPAGDMNKTDGVWMSGTKNESTQGNHSDGQLTAPLSRTAENTTIGGFQNETAKANLTDESVGSSVQNDTGLNATVEGGEIVDTTSANSRTIENQTALVNSTTNANSSTVEEGSSQNGTAQSLPATTLTTTTMNVGNSTSMPSPNETTTGTTSTMPLGSVTDMTKADVTNETTGAATTTPALDTGSTSTEALATTSTTAAEAADSTSGGGDTIESTTRVAEASDSTTEAAVSTTHPPLPAACIQKDVAYFPLDMLTHPVTRVDSVQDCQNHCAGIEGCAHFSYWVPGHHCHVQGEHAMKISSLLFVSGDRACGEDAVVDDAQDKSNSTTRATQMKFLQTPWFSGVSWAFRRGLTAETFANLVALVSVSLLLALLALRRSHRLQEWSPLAEHGSRFWPSSSRVFYAAFPHARPHARGDESGPWGSSYRGAQQFLGQDSGYVSLTPSAAASL